MLALLGWQLGHGTALQPWPSTLSNNKINTLPTHMLYVQSLLLSDMYAYMLLQPVTLPVSTTIDSSRLEHIPNITSSHANTHDVLNSDMSVAY